MKAATSAPGSSRGVNRGPVGVFGVIRSTRNVRQSARSRSQPTRYQRPPQVTTWCGSTRRGAAGSLVRTVRRSVVEPQHLARPYRGTDGDSRCSVRPVGRLPAAAGDGGDLQRVDPLAQPRRHDLADRGERPQRGLLDAGDACVVAVCSATATATACSSSNSSGGRSRAGVEPVAAVGALGRAAPGSRARAAGRRRGGRCAG